MKLFLAIYLLGSIISLTITLITLAMNKKEEEALIKHTNDKISEKFNFYDRVDFVNANIYCAVNFVMSWVQVAMFIYSYLPSPFMVKIYYYRFICKVFIWINQNSTTVAQRVVDKHNNMIKDFNKKYGIKEN